MSVIREEICKFVLGKAFKNWKTSFWSLTPSQIVGCLEALESKRWPIEDVVACKDILISWGWYREAGLGEKPPWEITDEDTDRLVQLAPWDPKDTSGQLGLFQELEVEVAWRD